MERSPKRQRLSSRRAERQQSETNFNKFWYDDLDLDDPTFGLVDKREAGPAQRMDEEQAEDYEDEDSIPTADGEDDDAEHDDGELDEDEIEAREQAALAKVRSKWDDICNRYGAVSRDMDVIDFKKLQVVVDNGHLAGMPDKGEDALWAYDSDDGQRETVDKTYTKVPARHLPIVLPPRAYPPPVKTAHKRALSSSRDRQLGKENARYQQTAPASVPLERPAEVVTQVVRQPLHNMGQQPAGAPMQYIVEETVVTTTRRYVQTGPPGQAEQIIPIEPAQQYVRPAMPQQIEHLQPSNQYVPPLPPVRSEQISQREQQRPATATLRQAPHEKQIWHDAQHDRQVEELYDSDGHYLDDYSDVSEEEMLVEPGSTQFAPSKRTAVPMLKRKRGRPRKIPIETVSGKMKPGRPRNHPALAAPEHMNIGRPRKPSAADDVDVESDYGEDIRKSTGGNNGTSVYRKKKMPSGDDHWTRRRIMGRPRKPSSEDVQDNVQDNEPIYGDDSRSLADEDISTTNFRKKKMPSGDDHWTRKRIMKRTGISAKKKDGRKIMTPEVRAKLMENLRRAHAAKRQKRLAREEARMRLQDVSNTANGSANDADRSEEGEKVAIPANRHGTASKAGDTRPSNAPNAESDIDAISQARVPRQNVQDSAYDFSDEEEDFSENIPLLVTAAAIEDTTLVHAAPEQQDDLDVLMEDEELDLDDMLEPSSQSAVPPSDPALLHITLTMAPTPLMTSEKLYGATGTLGNEVMTMNELHVTAPTQSSPVVADENEDEVMFDADFDPDDGEEIIYELGDSSSSDVLPPPVASVKLSSESAKQPQLGDSIPDVTRAEMPQPDLPRSNPCPMFPQEATPEPQAPSSGRPRRGGRSNLNEAELFTGLGLDYAVDETKARQQLPQDSPFSAPPKRRGRSPQDRLAPAPLVELSLAPPNLPKRPRGRPRKSTLAEQLPGLSAGVDDLPDAEPRSMIEVVIPSSPRKSDEEPLQLVTAETTQQNFTVSSPRSRSKARLSFPEDHDLDAEDEIFGQASSILDNKLSVPPSPAPSTPSRAKKHRHKLHGSAGKHRQSFDEVEVMPFRISQSPAPGSARRPISLFSSQDSTGSQQPRKLSSSLRSEVSSFSRDTSPGFEGIFKKPLLPSSQQSHRESFSEDKRLGSTTPMNRPAIQAALCRASMSRETPVPGTPQGGGTPARSRAGSVVSIRSRAESAVPESARKGSKDGTKCGDGGVRCGRKSCFKCSIA